MIGVAIRRDVRNPVFELLHPDLGWCGQRAGAVTSQQRAMVLSSRRIGEFGSGRNQEIARLPNEGLFFSD